MRQMCVVCTCSCRSFLLVRFGTNGYTIVLHSIFVSMLVIHMTFKPCKTMISVNFISFHLLYTYIASSKSSIPSHEYDSIKFTQSGNLVDCRRRIAFICLLSAPTMYKHEKLPVYSITGKKCDSWHSENNMLTSRLSVIHLTRPHSWHHRHRFTHPLLNNISLLQLPLHSHDFSTRVTFCSMTRVAAR